MKKICMKCGGLGKITMTGMMIIECPDCKGERFIVEKENVECPVCKARDQLEKENKSIKRGRKVETEVSDGVSA